MNKFRCHILAASFILAVTTVARADQSPSPSPCEQIQAACGEAGFTQNAPGGRDMTSKCINPILQGQTVSGVKVDPDTVKKCNNQSSSMPIKKKRR